MFQRGSGTSVSSDLFIFIASPTLKSSQAHGSRHRLFSFLRLRRRRRGTEGGGFTTYQLMWDVYSDRAIDFID